MAETYCICASPEDERLMIECSGKDCKCNGGWVHPECFQLSPAAIEAAKAADSWMCPLCSGLVQDFAAAQRVAQQVTRAWAASQPPPVEEEEEPEEEPPITSDEEASPSEESEFDGDDSSDDGRRKKPAKKKRARTTAVARKANVGPAVQRGVPTYAGAGGPPKRVNQGYAPPAGPQASRAHPGPPQGQYQARPAPQPAAARQPVNYEEDSSDYDE